MGLTIGITVGISIIVSWVTTKIVTTKYLDVIDGYLRDCTEELKETVVDIVTKGDSSR